MRSLTTLPRTGVVLATAIALATAVVVLCVSGGFAPKTSYAAETTKSVVSTADLQIRENTPDKNSGGDTYIGVTGNDFGSGKDKSVLLKWDLSGIAPGTTVGGVSVTLSVANSSTQTYQAYALKRSWSESAATWNVYDTGKPWEVAGANGSLDRGATVVGSLTPKATGAQTFTISSAVVQGWVNDPASNKGIIIANTTNTDGFDIWSRESTDSSQRPKLTL